MYSVLTEWGQKSCVGADQGVILCDDDAMVKRDAGRALKVCLLSSSFRQ